MCVMNFRETKIIGVALLMDYATCYFAPKHQNRVALEYSLLQELRRETKIIVHSQILNLLGYLFQAMLEIVAKETDVA